MILWIAAALTMAGQTPAERTQEQAAVFAWVAQAGHRFEPGQSTEADLAPLVARLKGAKVIGIGEATHGTHEDQAAMLLCRSSGRMTAGRRGALSIAMSPQARAIRRR
jgi:hypothetical protein